jgi:proline iminopeptidase
LLFLYVLHPPPSLLLLPAHVPPPSYQDGASHLFPEQFAPYRDHIPEAERGDLIAAYYKRLTSDDEFTRLEAARRWSTWENATSKLYVDQEYLKRGEDDKVSASASEVKRRRERRRT